MKFSMKLIATLSILLVILETRAETPDDHPWVSQIANALREQPDVFSDMFLKLRKPQLAKLVRDTLKDWADNRINRCSTCKTVAFAAKQIAQIIDGYDSVRDHSHAVCLRLVPWKDGSKREEILCPGAVDLYGPHVVDILKSNRSTPAKICSNMNMCYEERSPYSIPKMKKQEGSVSHESSKHIPVMMEEDSHRWRTQRESKARDIINIAQFADIHIDPDYYVGSPTDCGLPSCCRPWNEGQGNASEFGEHGCNIPQRTVEEFMSKTASLHPDFIIYTGDNPAHHMWENETFAKQMLCSELVMESFERQLNNYTIFPAMGNHEPWPTNLFSLDLPATQDMITKFHGWWQNLADFGDEQLKSIDAGLYYSTMTPVEGLRLITVNSNFWYTFNFYNILNDGTDAVKAMENFMEAELEKAYVNKEKVIMSIHHPIGAADVITKYSQWYQDLMIRYKDIIVLQIGGHTHYDEVKMFYDENGSPASVQFISPSVTSLTENGGINPGMRMYELDAETFELVNFHQYHMNLINATDVMPDIELVYSMKEEYDLDDLSPANILQLLDRMEYDDDLFNRWLRHRETNAPRDFYEKCHGSCKTAHLCWNRHSSYEQVEACQNSITATDGPSVQTATNEYTVTSSENVTNGEITTQLDESHTNPEYTYTTSEEESESSSSVVFPSYGVFFLSILGILTLNA